MCTSRSFWHGPKSVCGGARASGSRASRSGALFNASCRGGTGAGGARIPFLSHSPVRFHLTTKFDDLGIEKRRSSKPFRILFAPLRRSAQAKKYELGYPWLPSQSAPPLKEFQDVHAGRSRLGARRVASVRHPDCDLPGRFADEGRVAHKNVVPSKEPARPVPRILHRHTFHCLGLWVPLRGPPIPRF